NAEDKVVDGRAGRFVCSSPIVAEATTLLEAVTYASNAHSRCSIFTDCLTIVKSLKTHKHRWPWECYGLLGSITNIIDTSPSISINFIQRNRNKFADWVARSARMNSLPQDWLQEILFTIDPPGGPL
ncbi:hypothetical protein LINPERHAP1_LOCUS31449, partial [Linum perenne]